MSSPSLRSSANSLPVRESAIHRATVAPSAVDQPPRIVLGMIKGIPCKPSGLDSTRLFGEGAQIPNLGRSRRVGLALDELNCLKHADPFSLRGPKS